MRPWRHLLLLIALAMGTVFVLDLVTGASVRAGGWLGAPRAALVALPDILVPTLAVALAIALGTLPPTVNSVRDAARMTIVVSCGAIALDALVPGARNLFHITAALRGALGDVGQVLTMYPAEHPRRVLVEALQHGAMLLAPVALAGIALGIGAWMHTRVIFRAPRDGVLARWIVSWIVAPGALAFVVNWSQGITADVLFRGAAPWLVLVPWMPVLVLGGLGWRAAAMTPRDVTHTAPSDTRSA